MRQLQNTTKLAFVLVMLCLTPKDITPALAQGGFRVHHNQMVGVQADKRVLALLSQIEEIAIKGQVAGACGEGRIFSKQQQNEMSEKSRQLFALGPSVIPDLIRCINSSGYFSKAGLEWSNGSRNRYQPSFVMNIPRGACAQVLISHGAVSIDSLIRSGLPATGERHILFEEVVGAIGPAAIAKIAPLLKSKDENERFWATSMINHGLSYINATADRENGNYEKLQSQIPRKQIAFDLSNTPLPKETMARDNYYELLGNTSYGGSKEMQILTFYLEKDSERNLRSSCASALLRIADRADQATGARCLDALGDAFSKETDSQVRDAIARNIGGDSFFIAKSRFAQKRIEILNAGLKDKDRFIRDRCSWGLRSLNPINE